MTAGGGGGGGGAGGVTTDNPNTNPSQIHRNQRLPCKCLVTLKIN